jgi:hypothetical protein
MSQPAVPAIGRRSLGTPRLHLATAVVWGIPLFLILFTLPFILHQNAWWEWQSHYWLLERQTAYVAAYGTPTYFLHISTGAFYPHNLFYAGPMLAALAYPAAIIGPWPVFVASIIVAVLAGYFGMWWTARNLGLSRELAVLPAATFAATPYVACEIYGRGAWAELVALSAAPVALGAVTALLWHPQRSRRGPLVALVLCGATIAGTHNLTLLMASTLMSLTVLALLPLAPGRAIDRARRLGSAIVAVALGVGLTAAWLVPNLWLGPDTAIAGTQMSNVMNKQDAPLFKLSNFFSPWPAANRPESPGKWFFVQPPVLALACTLAALGLVAWLYRRDRRLVASLTGLATLGLAIVLLIVNPQWWPHFPRLIQTIQIPGRLVPYLVIIIGLVMTIALTTLRSSRIRRALIAALTVAVGAQLAMAAAFIAIDSEAASTIPLPPKQHGDVRVHDEATPYSSPRFFPVQQFRVMSRPLGPAPDGPQVLAATGDPTVAEDAALNGVGATGQVLSTTAVWSPLIRVVGDAQVVGRDASGYATVRITRTDSARSWSATVRPACGGLCLEHAPWQVTAGRLLTLFSALSIVCGGCAVWLRRRRGTVSRLRGPS